jgi:Uma2 family endonuclease
MTPLMTPTSRIPTPLRWTCDAFHDLCGTGVFSGRKAILIDGVIVTMALPNPPHNTSLTLTHELLQRVCPAGHYVRNQQAFEVGTTNDPGPDLAVVPGSIRDYANRQATAAVLIVEVSDSTLFTDVTTKVEKYATAGVADYWVIDGENRVLLVFRDPVPLPTGLGATAYRTHFTLRPTDTISPLVAPSHSIAVADMLP